jgi:hypothetical protein
MRYTQFLNELIRNYNNSPQNLECQLIAETPESKAARSLNPKEPMLFEINEEWGDFWIKQDGNDSNVYWLMLKDDYQINRHNFSVIDYLFECRYSSYQTDDCLWELIRPAKLKLVTYPKTHFEHEAKGILTLPIDSLKLQSNFSTLECLQREIILLQSRLEELKSRLEETEQNFIFQKVYTRLKNKILSDIYHQLNSLTPQSSEE